MAGRPCKLTPELQAKICKALIDCAPRETAALVAGIGRTTFFKWMAAGTPKEDDEDAQVIDPKFRDFRDAVEKAEAQGQEKLIGMVMKAAPKDWKAAMTMLERRWPQQFARRIYKPEDNAESVTVTFKRPAMDADAKSDLIVEPPPLIEGGGKNGNGKG